MKKSRFVTVGAMVSAASMMTVALAAAPSASADGIGGISGWEPPTKVCGEGNLVPVLMTNATSSPQTYTWTVSGDLAEQVEVDPSQSANCPSRTGTGDWQQDGTGYVYSETVQPGETVSFDVLFGGVDENLIGDSNTFEVSGIPNGPSWYDMQLDLNLDGSFKLLYAYYENTGGTGANNGQNGFNIVQCSPSTLPSSGSVNVFPTPVVLTPYTTSVGGVNFGWSQPLCFAWLPEGENITSEIQSSTAAGQTNPGYKVTAAELQQINGSYVVNIGGYRTNKSSPGVNVAVASANPNGGPGSVGPASSLPTTPGSPGGWYGGVGNALAVVGVPVSSSQDTIIHVYNEIGAANIIIPASIVPGSSSGSSSSTASASASPSQFSVTGTTTLPEFSGSAQVVAVDGMYATLAVSLDDYMYNGGFGGDYETFVLSYQGPNGTVSFQQANSAPTIVPHNGRTAEMAVKVPIAASAEDAANGEYFPSSTYVFDLAVGELGSVYDWMSGTAPGWAATGTATVTITYQP